MYEDIKQIIKHTIIYGAGIYIGKAVGFLMIPLYTRALTPADYGILELLNLASYIISIILGMGISTAVYRFYFQYGEEERKSVISSALLFMAAISVVSIMALCVFAHNISALMFKGVSYAYYLRLILISTLFDIIAVVPSAYIRILRKSFFFSIISIVGLVIALILNIYLIIYCKMGVRGVLWSGIVASFFMTTAYLYYTLRTIKFRISFVKIKQMLKYGYPLIPEAIFIFILHFSNRYFLQHFLSLKEVGIFSLGYKFSIILPFLINQPFALIWSNYKFEIVGKPNADRIYSRIGTYYFLINITFFLFLSIFIKEIIYFLSSSAFHSAYSVVPIITLGFVFWGLGTTFDMGILLKNKTYLKAVVGGLAAITSLALNYLLIPRFGILGASIASFCSFSVLGFISIVVSNKLYYIPFEWSRIIKISAAAIVVYALSTLITVENIFL